MDAHRLSAASFRLPEFNLGQPLQFQRGRSKGRSRSHRARLRFGSMLSILALVAAFFFGLQRISLMALSSKALALKTVTITGATKRTAAAIRGIADSWQGTNLFVLDPSRIRADIQSLSWVKEARVVKHWPSRLEVAVRERTAMAVLEDEALTLVDEEGVRLEALDPAAAPSLPHLRAEDGFSRDYEEKISLARACLNGLPDDIKKDLAVVDVGFPGRVGLQLRDNPVWVYLNPGEALSGLAYFEHKVAAWQERFGRLEYVDLTVPDRAYLGPGQSAEGNGPPRAVSHKEVW